MRDTDTLVLNSALATLEQLAGVIEDMSDESYATPGAMGASIGQHVRHTLDHFRALADCTPGVGEIDYDQRERGVPVETDRGVALDEIRGVMTTLSGADAARLESGVTVRAVISGDGAEAPLESTFARELWFVTHHAIHHNALIMTVAREKGITLAEGFGRAPSTVNFERSGTN